MAVALAKVNTDTRDHVLGNRREVIVDITLDASYPTGGYALKFSDLGIDMIPDVLYVVPTNSGHVFAYDYANNKLKAYSGGSEVANTTDLHTVVGRLVCRGKGVGHTVS